MKTKALIVVMSHLSDAQEIINTQIEVGATQHINFAKYIILQCGGNLNIEIDPYKMWDEFKIR